MVVGTHSDTMLVERIAKLEEAVLNNEKLIIRISDKIDKMMEELHAGKFDSLSQYGDLKVRVSKLEQRMETEGTNNMMWYTKLGLLVALISTLINYVIDLIGR